MVIRFCNFLWRILVGAMFLLAAYGKWQEGIHWLPPHTIYDRLLLSLPGNSLTLAVHYAVLGFEIALGLWLFSGLKIRWSAMLSGLVVLGFTLLLVWELRSDSPSACGCGIRQVLPGQDPRADLIQGIIRNGLLILGCLWLMLVGPEPAAASPSSSTESARPAPK